MTFDVAMNDTYNVDITITLDVATRSTLVWRLISTVSPAPTLNRKPRDRGDLPTRQAPSQRSAFSGVPVPVVPARPAPPCR
ncbi:hypothetical protein T261_7995 [Streptomyces lydicus]|nr:hypothetical protein T261_7995 [Streptomyces lydicus]